MGNSEIREPIQKRSIEKKEKIIKKVESLTSFIIYLSLFITVCTYITCR